jgi:transcriptional regulator of NAD metabolism
MIFHRKTGKIIAHLDIKENPDLQNFEKKIDRKSSLDYYKTE